MANQSSLTPLPSPSKSYNRARVARHSVVTRTTPFPKLPDWLSRVELRTFLGISKSSADRLLDRFPCRYFGKHKRVSKYHFKPEATR